MFDITGSYTMAFVVGGSLCILSAIVIIQPYLYVKHHPHDSEEDVIAEKVVLAASTDISDIRYASHRDLVQMAVSLESLSGAKRALDRTVVHRSTVSLAVPKENSYKIAKNGSYLPVNKTIAALKLSLSTETI